MALHTGEVPKTQSQGRESPPLMGSGSRGTGPVEPWKALYMGLLGMGLTPRDRRGPLLTRASIGWSTP